MMVISIIAGLILLLLLAALLIKKEYVVTRSIVIERPAQAVYDYVRFLRNQENFSKWVMQDTQMKKGFRGTDGTVGFVYAWNGNKKVGEGEQEITSLEENKKVNIVIRFKRPFENTAQTPFGIEALSPGRSRLSWSMVGRNKFPMTIMNLFIDRMLGGDMAWSLSRLKEILENKNEQIKQNNDGK